jgi:flagellar biosynthesis protein|tara:strand:- start:2373 stop:2684 length:312 start_codon:yes stop_codon:yes gene_type:complete
MIDNKRNNKVPSAVSLKYDSRVNRAPIVNAKGKGLVADNIIRLAKINNIPIKEDPDLVQLLSMVDLNSEIPEPLYKVVAELLSFVYKINNEYPDKEGKVSNNE